jgi:hypothetical protein
MKTLLALALLLGPAAGFAAERAAFVGFLSDPNGRLFILYDGATKESSVWMKLGQTWHGLTPTTFDAKEERLTVSDGAAAVQLSLRDSKVAALDFVPAGKAAPPVAPDTVTYGPEAKLHLRNALISSPTGIMVSNRDQTIIAGDLLIERPDGMNFKITNGVVRIDGYKTSMSGDSVIGYKGSAPAPATAPEASHP